MKKIELVAEFEYYIKGMGPVLEHLGIDNLYRVQPATVPVLKSAVRWLKGVIGSKEWATVRRIRQDLPLTELKRLNQQGSMLRETVTGNKACSELYALMMSSERPNIFKEPQNGKGRPKGTTNRRTRSQGDIPGADGEEAAGCGHTFGTEGTGR